jgi:two-component system response regulator
MKKTILIIDDNEDDILLTKMALAKTGRDIRIESALSGETGLAMLRDGRPLPALILLDMKMTGMDGLEVLRRIRGDRDLMHIPVMMVTHSELESDKTASGAAGANGFFHKSVDLNEFKRDMERVLERWLG